ncbi:HAMP domain-containing histidine kinase [bacterium]|nr:HAMP domain-containing histidine kinase [bacterium]
MRTANFFATIFSLDYPDELIRMITKGIQKNALLGTASASLIFVVVLYDYIPAAYLTLWVFAMVLISITRVMLAMRLDVLTKQKDALKTRYLKYYIFVLVLNAFLWGLTSWLTVIYAPMLYTFFTLTLLLALAAGATMSLGSVYHAYFAFTSTMLVMLSSSFLYFGSEIHSIIALVIVLAMLILMMTGYTYFLQIKKMVELSAELQLLNSELEERVQRNVAEIIAKDMQLVHKERLAQMGELLGMIAHQWRQPLNIISAAVTDMDLKIQLGTVDYTVCQKNLETISVQTQHLSSTIDDFRDFFKMTKEKEETSLEEIVTATLSIVKEFIENQKIAVKTDLHSSESFNSYPNELKQVLLNLLKNAEDVLIERGVVEAEIKIKSFSDEENLYLEVCDNAGGVPEEMMAYVFNAYYSSKPQEKGTGLGLYMSKMIIEEHCGGELTLRNEEEGACFRIALPK